MNPVHVHLVLNHVPVIAVLFGAFFLLWGVLAKSADLRKAGLAAFILAALSAAPVFLSGAASERVVEETLSLPEQLIERHEEAARLSLAAVTALGLLSLWGLGRGRRAGDAPSWILPAIAALALSCLGLLARTSWLGGHIRHPEIQRDLKELRAALARPARPLTVAGSLRQH